MSRLLRTLLTGQTPALEDDTEDPVPPPTEAEVLEGAREVQEIMTQEANEASVLGLLEEQVTAIDDAKRAGDFPPALEAYSTLVLRQTLSLLSTNNSVALEALAVGTEDSNILQRAGNRIIQSEVVNWKQFVDSITQAVESAENRRTEYDKRLAKTLAEYKEKSPGWKSDDHTGSMASLGLHFFLRDFERGESKFEKAHRAETDPVQALATDTAYSRYLLDTWPRKALEYMKRLTSIVGTAKVKNDKDLVAVIKKVEGLGYLPDQFRRDLLDPGVLLDVHNLKLSKEQQIATVSLDGETFERLTRQANNQHIEFKGRIGRKLGKAFIATLGGTTRAVDSAMAPSFKYSGDDIEAAVKYGHAYLDSTETYQKLSEEFGKAYKAFSEAMSRFYSTNTDLSREQRKVVRQFTNVAMTARSNFTNPAIHEVGRALVGARASNYLALRMIASAS